MKFKRKITTSIQFEPHQYDWLDDKATLKEEKEGRKVSISEINREVLQNAIEREKKDYENIQKK